MGSPPVTQRRRRHTATPPGQRLRGGVAARTWPSVLAAVSAAGIVTWLAFRSGGYFPDAYLPAGVAAWGMCAVILAVRPPLYLLSTHALLGLGALASLTAWTAISTGWSLDPIAGTEDLQRDLVYVGLFGLGLLGAGSGRLAGWVVRLIGLAALGVVIAALTDRLTGGGSALGFYRLDYPLTYWNGLGALCSLTAVLALGLAADHRANVLWRAGAAGAALLAAVTMYLTLSRGAWMALAVGLVVLVLIAPRRRFVVATAAFVGGLFAIALLVLRSYPALVTDPLAGDGQTAAGRAFLPVLLVLTAIAVSGQAGAVLAAGRLGWRLQPMVQAARRTAPYGAAAIVLVLVCVYAVSSTAVEARANDGGGYVSRQWRDFLQTSTPPSAGTARLTNARGTRSEIYRVAIDGWQAHPLLGDGAGSFRVRWARDRKVAEDVRNAHSLYLETLSDTGLVGFGLLMAFLASLVLAAVRSIRRPGGLSGGEGAAVAAACSVWAVHSAVDWDWQLTSLTGLTLVLAATLYPYGRRSVGAASGRTR